MGKEKGYKGREEEADLGKVGGEWVNMIKTYDILKQLIKIFQAARL